MSATATVADVLEGRARWTVICSDNAPVLAGMADKSADHVITDPPYEAECHENGRRVMSRGGVQRPVARPIGFAKMDGADRVACSLHFARTCRRWALVFCQVEGVNPWRDALAAAGARWRRAQVWLKPDATPQLTGDRPAQAFEMIASAWCGPGKSMWNGGGRRGYYVHTVVNVGRATGVHGATSDHPTPKPLPLMLELVSLFTDPDDIILDPFAGSGTTGVAALRLGRRAILIEKDAAYAEIARERMTAESEGSTLRDRRAGQLPLLQDFTPGSRTNPNSRDGHEKAAGRRGST